MAPKEQNYYEILGLKKNATPQEIKKNYHLLQLQYHPDKNKSSEALEMSKKISAAYECLKDIELKKIYDSYLPKGHNIAEKYVQEQMKEIVHNETKKNEEKLKKEILREKSLPKLEKLSEKINNNIDLLYQTSNKEERKALEKSLNDNITEHKHIRKEADIQYPIGENSKIYKLLMSGNEDTIARLIDKMSVRNNNQAQDKKGAEFSIETIIKNSPPELLLKMCKIAEKVEERNGQKVNGFKDAINKFCNGLKMVLTFGILGTKDNDIKEGIKEFENIIKKPLLSNPNENTSKKLQEGMGKFTNLVSKASSSSNKEG